MTKEQAQTTLLELSNELDDLQEQQLYCALNDDFATITGKGFWTKRAKELRRDVYLITFKIRHVRFKIEAFKYSQEIEALLDKSTDITNLKDVIKFGNKLTTRRNRFIKKINT